MDVKLIEGPRNGQQDVPAGVSMFMKSDESLSSEGHQPSKDELILIAGKRSAESLLVTLHDAKKELAVRALENSQRH